MPNREWRKCETCEWFEEQQERCRLIAYTRGVDSFYPGKDFWCSEWKSAEPETCGMCEWYINEILDRCLHADNINRKGFYVNSDFGACEHFRRKDAD